jgi:hypothetical protein
LKIKRSEKTKKSEIQIRDIGKLNKKEVHDEFIKDIAANVQNTQLQEVEDINEILNKMKQGINEAVGKIIGKKKGHKEIIGLIKDVK